MSAEQRPTAVSLRKISLLLAAGAFSLPYLVAFHEAPVPSFYAEWLGAALMALAALVMGFTQGIRFERLNWPFVGFCILLVLLGLRALHSSSAPLVPLAMIYGLLALISVSLGRQLASGLGAGSVATVLAAAVLISAVLNALIGIAQYYGVPSWASDYVSHLVGSRAYGNIAQANLYANYLALGEASLLFFYVSRRFGAGVFTLMAVVLLWGSALSASRSALLYPFAMALLAHWASRRCVDEAAGRLCTAALFFGLAAVAMNWALPQIHQTFGLERAAAAFARASDGAIALRLEVWREALLVFISNPWLGVGIGHFAGDAFLRLGTQPDAELLWTSAHNLFLQLGAEMGVGGLVAAAVLLIGWMIVIRRRLSAPFEAAQWWFAAAASVQFLHSMVEYPLWSAHFLGMTAVLIGASMGADGSASGRPLASGMRVQVPALVLCLLLGWTMRDYGIIDRTRISGAGLTLEGRETPDSVLLRSTLHGPLAPLAQLSIARGLVPEKAQLAAQSALTAEVVRFWPSAEIVVRRAILLAYEGRGTEANELIVKLRRHGSRRLLEGLLEAAAKEDPAAIQPLISALRGV